MTSAAPGFDVAAVQAALSRLGYTTAIDGMMGPHTRQMLRDFALCTDLGTMDDAEIAADVMAQPHAHRFASPLTLWEWWRAHAEADLGEIGPSPRVHLLGLRHPSRVAGAFDDVILLRAETPSGVQYRAMAATTDPGASAARDPGNPKGIAILQTGHYPDMWRIGLHKGRYTALVQTGTTRAKVWRDDDGDADLEQHAEDSGWLGINFHAAASDPFSEIRDRRDSPVGRWSEGCQVVAQSLVYRMAIRLIREARPEGVAYTLLTGQVE